MGYPSNSYWRFWKIGWAALMIWLPVLAASAQDQQLRHGTPYRASLLRQDGHQVIFNLRVETRDGRNLLILRNGDEQINITDLQLQGDSLFFNMPTFESYFRVRILPNGDWQGHWIKPTESEPQIWDFRAVSNEAFRFKPTNGNATAMVQGRWRVTFTRKDGSTRPAVAELRQQGNRLTGTFLTPTGDYRYLEGIVSGDSLQLSTFDGAHAYGISARYLAKDSLGLGIFTAGAGRFESWTAVRDASAALPPNSSMAIKEDSTRLRFRFPDLNGKWVSINDARYSGKVVVIQIMGSWCPNCLDETKFLSDFYDHNRQRGVEVLALAYEYSTDTARSRKSVAKFRDRFQVHYPMLITGVTSIDPDRAEKTLPQLTAISVFPATLFVGKDGTLRELHTGFYGPGAGEYFEVFKKQFYETVNRLLAE